MATLNDKIKATFEAEKAMREAASKVRELTNKFDGWVFSIHTHWDQPRVSVWKSDSYIHQKETVSFMLNDDGEWQMNRIGGYSDEKAEVEAVFKALLSHDVDC